MFFYGSITSKTAKENHRPLNFQKKGLSPKGLTTNIIEERDFTSEGIELKNRVERNNLIPKNK